MKKKQTEYTTDNWQIHADKVLDAMAKRHESSIWNETRITELEEILFDVEVAQRLSEPGLTTYSDDTVRGKAVIQSVDLIAVMAGYNTSNGLIELE